MNLLSVHFFRDINPWLNWWLFWGGGGGGGGGGFLPPPLPPPISYTVTKTFLTSLTSWALFYSHKIYVYTFWPILDNFFAEGHEIWPFCEERYNISRISDTYKKSFICILLKYRYILHTLLHILIRDFLVRPMMTYLWRHHWLHDVLWRLSKQKYKVNYDVISREAWVDS